MRNWVKIKIPGNLTSKKIISLIFILLGLTTFAQTPKYYSLSTEEGIISNHIDYTFVDSYGFVWMATYDGLQRWEGIKGYTYTHQKDNPNSLSSNICYTVFEDDNKDIWIGTINGLCKYDRNNGKISRINLGKINTPVNAMAKKDAQNLWIGTSNGLCAINIKTATVSWPKSPLANLSIFALANDQEKNTWAGTFEKGIFRIDPHTLQLTNFQKANSGLLSNKIRTILCDSKGRIWTGTFDKGISVMNTKGEILFQLQHFGKQEHPNGGFDEVRSIYEDRKHQLWVGLLDQPLYKFDERKKDLIPQLIYSQNHAGKSAEGIFAIAEDQFGNMWLGTHGMGLFYTNSFKNNIGTVGGKSQVGTSSSRNIITSLVVDSKGNTWAGTDGGGLLKTDQRGNTSVFTVKDGLSSDAIHHLSIDNNGLLWVSTWGGGIMSMNMSTNQINTYIHNPKNPFSLTGDNSKIILPDDSLVWIGTHGDGIAILERQTGKIYNYLNNKKYPFNLKAPAWVNHIYKDKKNRIWISTCFGLYLIANNKLSSYHVADKNSDLNSDYINMVTENHTGKIWIVGEDGGLQWFNEKSKQFVAIRNKNIPSCIKSIVVDKSDNLWLGTNIGLFSYNTHTQLLKHYNYYNGLQGNHFFHKASFCGIDGTIYEGGMNGYNFFKPEAFETTSPPLHIFFENAALQGDGPDTTIQLTGEKELVIPYQYKVTNLSFSIPNQFAAHNLKIAYRLEGLNQQWIHIPNDAREISLTGLAPDAYPIYFKYSQDGLKWTTFPNKLIINVLPPWWQTVWFKGILLVLIMVSLVAFYYLRTANIRYRNKLLKETVAERTSELLETNLALLEKNDETMIQNEQLEQLNLEYKKQTHTIIQHQNTILAKNRNLNSIIAHVSQNDNGEINAILADLNESRHLTYSPEDLVKVALYKTNPNNYLETTLATIALISICNQEEELLHYLPDFILIDDQFNEAINPLLSHIPIIRIIGKDALVRSPLLMGDINIVIENLEHELPEQLKKYIISRKLINERFAQNESMSIEELSPHSADKEFLEQTIAIIENHISNSLLDSELLCEELLLSRTVLYSKIKLLTGMGVHEYIKMIRVKKSIELLKARKLNVSQIAYEVGFSSPSYFIRCFVKQLGMPPKEYINQQS